MSYGPDGLCWGPYCREVKFGSLAPLPAGYAVWWHEEIEMYMAHGPDGWESPITWNRFWARGWCFDHWTRRPREDHE